MSLNVMVLEECDGFELRVVEEGQTLHSVRINQEDSVVGLVSFFEDMGYTTHYEEVY